jgi:hypothetical protein
LAAVKAILNIRRGLERFNAQASIVRGPAVFLAACFVGFTNRVKRFGFQFNQF